MFGYVQVNRDTLSREDEARFKTYYCGLCRSLRKNHSLIGGLTLSNDMAFLSMLLSALYECPTASGSERCAMHPAKMHDFISNEAIDYAADMNLMLAYYLCDDDWRDDRNPVSLGEMKLLKNGLERVKGRYPEKCAFVRDMIEALSEIEKKPPNGDIDAPTNISGELIGEIFAWKDDEWKNTLTRMGAALGRFIYIMDAYDDLPSDRRKKRYNPLIPIADEPDFEDRCLDMLTMHISECANYFEMLPIITDAPIIRNVLYSGVWNKYAYIQNHKKKKEQR